MKEVYIIDAVRTAIGNFGGTLGPVRTDDLGAHVIKEELESTRHGGSRSLRRRGGRPFQWSTDSTFPFGTQLKLLVFLA